MTIYYQRKYLVEDDPFALSRIQPHCYLTGATPKRCSTHEWFIKRSCGLPRAAQGKIFHNFNMVLVELATHDKGLNAYQELFICANKIKLHGFDAIELWRESLMMRASSSLEEWIYARIRAASFLDDAAFCDTFGKAPRHQQATLFLEWSGHLRNILGDEPQAFSLIRNGDISPRKKPAPLA